MKLFTIVYGQQFLKVGVTFQFASQLTRFWEPLHAGDNSSWLISLQPEQGCTGVIISTIIIAAGQRKIVQTCMQELAAL